MKKFIPVILLCGSFVLLQNIAVAEEFEPYGTAKVSLHEYPVIDTVFDANYDDPNNLHILYGFVRNTLGALKGDVVVVTHGPELRVFAKENYLKYQGIVDRMAELAEMGVKFSMCNNAMQAAGFEASDMHGFITVIPAGFPEIAYLQTKGYKYINPIPLEISGIRYLDQPQLQKNP